MPYGAVRGEGRQARQFRISSPSPPGRQARARRLNPPAQRRAPMSPNYQSVPPGLAPDYASVGATGPFPVPQQGGGEVPNQGAGGATAGVPADQMAFLQQIGTMVQSAMQPFAQQLTVEVSQLGARVDMIQTELQAEIARRTAVQQHKSPSSEGLSNISVTGFGERPPVTQQAFGVGGAPVPPPGNGINQVGGPAYPPVPPMRGTSRRQDHRLHRVRSHPMKDPQMEGISSLVLTSGCLRCRFQTSRSGRLRDRKRSCSSRTTSLSCVRGLHWVRMPLRVRSNKQCVGQQN